MIKTDTYHVGRTESSAGQSFSQTAQSLTQATLSSLQGVLGQATNQELRRLEAEEKVKQNQYIEKAIVDGTAAVTDDMYVADLLDGTDVYSTAYNKAAKARTQNNIQRDVTIQGAEIAAKYGNDPELYRQEMYALSEGYAEQFGEGTEELNIVNHLVNENITRYEPQITVNAYQLLKADEAASFTDALTTTVNTGLTDIRNGNFSRIESLLVDANQEFNLGVERGYFKEADRETYIRGIKTNATVEYVTGGVNRSLEANQFNSAYDAVDQWRSEIEPTGLMSPDEMDKVEVGLYGSISRKESAYNKQLKELDKQAKLTTTLTNSANMVKNHMDAGIAMSKTPDNIKAVDNVFLADMLGIPIEQLGTQKNATAILNSAEYRQGLSNAIGTPEGRSKIVEFSQQTGLIPTVVVESVKNGLMTDDPIVTQRSAELFASIKQLDNKTIVNSFGSDVVTYFNHWNNLVDTGYTLEQATLSANKAMFEKDSPTRNLLKTGMSNEEFKEGRIKAAQSFANSDPNGGFFVDDIEPDLTNPRNLEYLSDYNVIYDDAYLNSNGDAEIAEATANSFTQRKWGRTTINGIDQFMRYPPESFFNGDTDWIKTQWDDDIATIKHTNQLSDESTVTLVSDYRTRDNGDYAVQIVESNDEGLVNVRFLLDNNGDTLRWKPVLEETSEYKNSVSMDKDKLTAMRNTRKANEVKQVEGTSSYLQYQQ